MIKLIALVLVIVLIGAVEGELADVVNKFTKTIKQAAKDVKHAIEESKLRINDVRFVIKHKSSGVYWMPEGGSNKPIDNSEIVTHAGAFGHTVWQFEHFERQWGYIRHSASNKYIHPYGSELKPYNWTNLVIKSGKHAGCQFALDANRDIIIHKGGLFAQPGSLRTLLALSDNLRKHVNDLVSLPNPPDNTNINLRSGIDDAMKWQFMDPDDTRKEVLVYGKPKMTGEWKHIFTHINPKGDRTDVKTVVIGKSNTTTATSSFKYTWELNAGFSIGKFNFGGSRSVEKMFTTATSQTWTTQTTRTRTIAVKGGGPSVVVWQYVFYCEQNDHRSQFRSDIIVDTDSLDKKPDIDVSS